MDIPKKISIVVLTYNQENTICRTLDSILSQQTQYSYEIVIGEDCSTDGTREICERYVAQYPNQIRLMPGEPNKGSLRNFRDTLSQCRGEYVAQCAGDDWWHNPIKIQLQIDFLEANPSIGMVHSDINTYDPVSGRIINSINKICDRTIPSNNYAESLLTEIFPIYTPTPCYRKSLMDKVDINLFIRQGWMMEDLPMWLEMSRYTSFGYINQSLATYTSTQNSACRPASLAKHLEFEESVTNVQLYYRENYFPEIALRESIIEAGIRRKVMVYRRFKEYRPAFENYQTIKCSGSLLRRMSQKSYYLYRFLIWVSKHIK